ncbi:hypothetical protein WJX72_008834 [[Myrmecia] bisecta]|uniref:TauD/TfdA-like domain-containing protein n=1 Tax=[Myrmecia] bisecta TaxID=41462 RepID=A0AAW1R862_9CHLO
MPTDYSVAALTEYEIRSIRECQIPPRVDVATLKQTLRSSGPQGRVEPFTLVKDPTAWTAAQFQGSGDHIYWLTPADIAEIDTALALVEDQGLEIKAVTKDQFPLPRLGPQLSELQRNVTFGRGFQLIKGLAVDKYTRRQVLIIWKAFGLYWGALRPMNKRGHMITHVTNIEKEPLESSRGYTSADAITWHNDNADIVALLCLTVPKGGGGVSSFASGIAIHNELLKRGRQDLVEELAASGWYRPRTGWNEAPKVDDGRSFEEKYYSLPIFNYHQGYLSVSYEGPQYFRVHKDSSAPRLTEKQAEALAMFSALAASDELRMDTIFEPGTIQMLHNPTCVHFRSQVHDGEAEGQRRHLLRIWVAPAEDRPIPALFAHTWGGSTEVGKRGGWFLEEGVEPWFPEQPVMGDL